eukprot:scaffold3036_cov414-Prasinococcus_capsulatus_cf.AAC.4
MATRWTTRTPHESPKAERKVGHASLHQHSQRGHERLTTTRSFACARPPRCAPQASQGPPNPPLASQVWVPAPGALRTAILSESGQRHARQLRRRRALCRSAERRGRWGARQRLRLACWLAGVFFAALGTGTRPREGARELND